MLICENSVEFIGIPGSGKSTLYKYCINKPNTLMFPPFSGMRLYDNIEKLSSLMGVKRSFVDSLFHSALFQFYKFANKKEFRHRHNHIISHINLMLEKSNFSHDVKVVKRFIEFNFFLTELTSGSLKRFRLRDEGAIQKIASCHIGIDDYGESLINFVEHVILPKYLIYLDIKPSLALDRIKQRGVPHRLKGKSDQNILAFLIEYQSKLKKISECAVEQGVLLYKLDINSCVNSDLELNFSKIRNFLLKL
jgi:shikimate kinase